MSFLTIVILIFFGISALDYLFGSKFGIGKEFERGFLLLGTMSLSMIGMVVISPLIASTLAPVFEGMYRVLHIDPSVFPALLFANDMGGASLATAIAENEAVGAFNALVISSMMGATISFTIPLSMQLVKKENQRELALGLLCGVVTIPIGSFISGLICDLPIGALLLNLLPLIILDAIIAAGLIFFPNACVKVFRAVGMLIKILVMAGLVLGVINFLGKREIIPGLGTVEEGAMICFNASIVMAGMFPLIYIVSKLLAGPLDALGGKFGIGGAGITGLVSTLATNVTTFGMMDKMNKKGIMVNSAFATSAAFTFAGHLAFTMAFNESYVLAVTVGKLIAGALALLLAFVIYGRAVSEK